jgi:hypothetical protein
MFVSCGQINAIAEMYTNKSREVSMLAANATGPTRHMGPIRPIRAGQGDSSTRRSYFENEIST